MTYAARLAAYLSDRSTNPRAICNREVAVLNVKLKPLLLI